MRSISPFTASLAHSIYLFQTIRHLVKQVIAQRIIITDILILKPMLVQTGEKSSPQNF